MIETALRACHLVPWAVGLVFLAGVGFAIAQERIPADFIYLRDAAPPILQDIRYAEINNFVGHALPGYEAPECILKRTVATALAQVQQELAPQGISLKVYDCYRPERAVRAMFAWATDGNSGAATKRFFPRVDKGELFARGYIAMSSTHSRGSSIDLTLVKTRNPASPSFDPTAAYGPCNGPAQDRAPDDSVDMGTGFDCFDQMSYTAARPLGVEQRRWRDVLVNAMSAHGFANYYREWWHFTLASEAHKSALDFPIVARGPAN